MFKKIGLTLLVLLALIIAYFVFWPSPIEPATWEAPQAPELTGPVSYTHLTLPTIYSV